MSGSATNSAASLIRAEEDEPQLKKLRQSDSQRKDEGIDRRASAKKSKKTASLLRFKKSGKVSHQNEINKPNGWVNAQKTRKNGTSTAPSGKSIPQTETFTQKNEQKQSFSNFVKSMFGSGEEELNINRSERTKLFYFGFLLPALALHPESLKECDTPKYDEDFKLRLAAAHINDAIHSRGKFGQARALLKSEYVQKCYAIISSKYWEYLMYLFIGLHCFMAFWEQSPVPTPVGQPWSDNWVMHVSVLVIDAMCSVIYVIDIILWTGFLSWSHFWSAKENFWIRVEFVFTAMFIIDYVILVCERALNQRLIAPFRCLRAAMLLCKSKNVSHIFKVLISIMSRLGKVFSIILIFIFTFASIGLHLYMDDYHEVYQSCSSGTQVNCTSVYSGAFDNVAIASLHMFVLMSTENYPDIIIPAFSASEANFFYFMFYLYAGVFFLTAILLAIIVESYWEYSKKHVKMERLRQREELIRAWNLLDLDGNGYLSVDDQKLVKLFSILRPKNTEDENQQLVQYMSENNEDYVIDSFDWTTRLVETLSIEFEPEIQEREGSENISVCRSIRKFSSKIIHANGIGVAILVFILLHSIFFCLMWHGITDTTQLALQGSRTVIVFLFVLEAILRITSDGAKLLNILDVLDILMVVIAVAGNVTWYILWFGLAHTTSHQLYIGACVVTSSLAVLARLLFNSEQARSAFHILKNIYPVMFDLILLVISIIYFYAIIGLEIFQDK